MRDDEPDCKAGDEIVVATHKPKPYWDEDLQEILTPPPQREVWIKVISVVRHRKGGWMIEFRVTDNRQDVRFLARQQGRHHPQQYTSSASGSIDDEAPAVSDEDLRVLRGQAAERWAEHRKEEAAEEELRRQRQAVDKQLRVLIRGLPYPAAQALLSRVQRLIEEAQGEEEAA